MILSLLTGNALVDPLEQQVADFADAGGQHVYIDYGQKQFPYTDGTPERNTRAAIERVFQSTVAKSVTVGMAVLSLSKYPGGLFPDPATGELVQRVDPVTIPTRKIVGAPKAVPIPQTVTLLPGRDSYRHYKALSLESWRLWNVRFRNDGPGHIDFFWRAPDERRPHVIKRDYLRPGVTYTIQVHSLDADLWQPMWRCGDTPATLQTMSVQEAYPVAGSMLDERDGWYDFAGKSYGKPSETQTQVNIQGVECRSANPANRAFREQVYRNVDRIHSVFGHHVNRGPDWIYCDEWDWVGYRKVGEDVPPFVNAAHAISHEVVQAALYTRKRRGHKPRGWADWMQPRHSGQEWNRGNSGHYGGMSGAAGMVPQLAPFVPALWHENPPADVWAADLIATGAREKAVCIYLDHTDPAILHEAIQGVPPEYRPTEVILYNTEGQGMRRDSFEYNLRLFK